MNLFELLGEPEIAVVSGTDHQGFWYKKTSPIVSDKKAAYDWIMDQLVYWVHSLNSWSIMTVPVPSARNDHTFRVIIRNEKTGEIFASYISNSKELREFLQGIPVEASILESNEPSWVFDPLDHYGDF